MPLLDAIVSIRLLGFVSRINERMKKVRALFRLNYTIYISTFDNKNCVKMFSEMFFNSGQKFFSMDFLELLKCELFMDHEMYY